MGRDACDIAWEGKRRTTHRGRRKGVQAELAPNWDLGARRAAGDGVGPLGTVVGPLGTVAGPLWDRCGTVAS